MCSVCTKHLILATACTGFHVHAGRVCMCASPRWVQRGCCHGDRRPASAAVGATAQCPGSYLLIHPERQLTNQPTPCTHIPTWTRRKCVTRNRKIHTVRWNPGEPFLLAAYKFVLSFFFLFSFFFFFFLSFSPSSDDHRLETL